MADRESSEPLAVDKTSTNNPLSRKLNKILETRLENDKDTLEALKGLSTFFIENSLRTRRNLRSDIERQSLAINEEFASAFGEIKMQLDSVYEDVKGMSKCCEEMTNRLKTAKAQTHDLIDKTTGLQAESQRLQIRSQVVEAFLSTFQLKPEEVKLLRVGRDNALNPGFFTALARVKQIHNDCKLLLRTNQQTAGLDIMESMALHQEAAYERLYRWTQGECRLLNSDLPDISSLLCLAMESLQDRPVLFKYSLDEFATARRTAIVKGFINALTRGGPGGTPRPIELHSHDPLRYAGDMLAWLHQNTASEKEHLETLLRKCSNKTLEEHSGNVLAHITEGLCRPFKVRVEQVIIAEPGAVMLYKLTNLLKFYHNTISQMLPAEALLLTTIEETYVLSLKMFFTSLNRYAAKMLESVELPPNDLGPTTSLNQTLTLLKDILTSHDSSLVSLDDKQQDFAQILSCVVDPLIQFCLVSASKLNTLDMATYMVNCIYSISSTLALYEFTDQRLEMLQAQIEAHLDTLVSEQASYILNSSGMAYMYNVIQQHQPKQGPLSSVVGMDSASIKAAMSKFDGYLAAPDSLIIPQCSLLLSATLRETLKKRSVELIHIAYKQMYQVVMDPVNAYQASPSLMPRTPEQISSLLL